MSQCVRVLGFTDLRIEHILLLLCCYCNYMNSENEIVVNQLLGELLDISAGIEDYHVWINSSLNSRALLLYLFNSCHYRQSASIQAVL